MPISETKLVNDKLGDYDSKTYVIINIYFKNSKLDINPYNKNGYIFIFRQPQATLITRCYNKITTKQIS